MIFCTYVSTDFKDEQSNQRCHNVKKGILTVPSSHIHPTTNHCKYHTQCLYLLLKFTNSNRMNKNEDYNTIFPSTRVYSFALNLLSEIFVNNKGTFYEKVFENELKIKMPFAI